MEDNVTTPQDGEVAHGMTEDQAASELLKRWGEKEAPESDEPAPEPEDDQPQGDDSPEEAPEEEDDPESGEVEIDVAGEKFKFSAKQKEQAERIQAKAKEVEAGATRKFQEAADLRKAAEARSEQVDRMTKIATAQADLLADHKFIVRRLAQYEQINVQEMAQQDPARLTAINAEYNQLTLAKSRLEAAYGQRVSEMDAETTKAEETAMQSLHDFASKHLKGWGKEADDRLGKYLGERGIDRKSMLAVLTKDPKFLLVLEDAAYGQKVRTATPQRAQPTQKTLKPGSSAATKPAQAQKADQAMARLRKSGSAEDAAMALLARSSIRRK